MATFSELTGELLNFELHSADTSQLFTSTRRNLAVNAGYQEFAVLTECFIRRSSITCSCNTTEYVLSTLAGFSRLHASGPEYRLTSSGSSGLTTILAGDGLPRRDEVWRNRFDAGWRQSTTPRQPTGYYLRMDGGRLFFGFDVPPDIGSSETAVLRVPYVAIPDAMTASTDVPFTLSTYARNDLAEYHQGIVHYATHQLEKLRGDDEASDRQYAKFLQYIDRFRSNTRDKAGRFVTYAKSYLRNASRRPVDSRAERQWS